MFTSSRFALTEALFALVKSEWSSNAMEHAERSRVLYMRGGRRLGVYYDNRFFDV